MAMDFTSPKTTDNYSTQFVPNIISMFLALGMMGDPTLVGTYTGLATGIKRFNESTQVFERYSTTTSSWTAQPTGYALKAGDNITGSLVFANNIGLQFKNTGGTAVQSFVLNSSNNFYIGDVNNSISGGTTALRGNTQINFDVNATTVGYMTAGGMTMSQMIQSTAGEVFRIVGSASYLTGYNTANTTRTGYLQFNTGASVILAAENGAVLSFAVGGTTRLTIDTGGTLNAFGSVVVPNADSYFSKDTGGTVRALVGLNASNNVQLGAVNNDIAGSYTYVNGVALLVMQVNGSAIAQFNSGGLTMNVGQYVAKGTGEGLRIQYDGGYISFWNSANTVRQGYVQGTGTGSLAIVAENGNKLAFGVGSTIHGGMDTTGAIYADNGFGTTAYVTNGQNPIWRFMNSTGYGISYFQGTSGMNGVDSIGVHFGTATSTAAMLNLATDRMSLTGSLLINAVGSTWATSGRGVIEINGSSNSLLGFRVNGIGVGYVYHDGTNLQLLNTTSTGVMNIGANGANRLVISAAGVSTFNGAALTAPPGNVNSGTALTLDCRASNVFQVTMTGNVPSGSVALQNPQDGQTINIFLTQDGTGTRTMAFSSSFKWPGGTVGVLSTAANAVDLLCLTYRAATGFWYCTLAKAFA